MWKCKLSTGCEKSEQCEQSIFVGNDGPEWGTDPLSCIRRMSVQGQPSVDYEVRRVSTQLGALEGWAQCCHLARLEVVSTGEGGGRVCSLAWSEVSKSEVVFTQG